MRHRLWDEGYGRMSGSQARRPGARPVTAHARGKRRTPGPPDIIRRSLVLRANDASDRRPAVSGSRPVQPAARAALRTAVLGPVSRRRERQHLQVRVHAAGDLRRVTLGRHRAARRGLPDRGRSSLRRSCCFRRPAASWPTSSRSPAFIRRVKDAEIGVMLSAVPAWRCTRRCSCTSPCSCSGCSRPCSARSSTRTCRSISTRTRSPAATAWSRWAPSSRSCSARSAVDY